MQCGKSQQIVPHQISSFYILATFRRPALARPVTVRPYEKDPCELVHMKLHCIAPHLAEAAQGLRSGAVWIRLDFDTYKSEDTESTESGVSLGDGNGLLKLLESGVPVQLWVESSRTGSSQEWFVSMLCASFSTAAVQRRRELTSLSICHLQ